MSVYIDVDISSATRELHRLEHGPPLLVFDQILTGLFQETQAVVHVITGSLRNSGTHHSEAREHSWHGEIRYGGASPGFIHDPVDYAVYEYERGDVHNFMAPTRDAHRLYLRAIDAYLRGEG